jgi:hypothetical protein
MSRALQIRWLWYRKTNANRVWCGLEFIVHPNATALFSIAVISMVGRRNNTLFWSGRWLFGCCISDLAPKVFEDIPI